MGRSSNAQRQMQLPTRLPRAKPASELVEQEPELGAGAQKVFRPYNPDQVLMLPPDLGSWVPPGHLARLVSDLVESVLDLSPIYASYKVAKGAPPYHPKLLLTLLLYGYATGTYSSRRLERAAQEFVPCRYLSGDQQPDHWTISEFRRRHLGAVKDLFAQVLNVCREAGLVKLGHAALDGTKVKANASKHKAMSYGRVREREPEYERIVEGWLRQAEEIDQAENREFGRERRGDELPEELQRAETRLQKLREAKEAIERRAQEQGREPLDKDQHNFSDPDSRIMLSADKAFVQAYNCQAMVDDTEHHIVIATGLSNQAADNPHLLGMLLESELNTGRLPDKLSVDAGYAGETNLFVLDRLLIDAHVAVDKDKHSRDQPAPRGRIPKSAGLRERMRRKTRTKSGRKVYARRKHVVEPVFGFIKQALGFRQFLLRGLAQAPAEWELVSLAYNLRRLHASGRFQLVTTG